MAVQENQLEQAKIYLIEALAHAPDDKEIKDLLLSFSEHKEKSFWQKLSSFWSK